MAVNPKKSFFIPNIVYVILIGLIVRLALSFFGTLQLDHGTFIAWSNNLASNGFGSFYNSWSDYLPGYLYVLWGLGKISLLKIISPTLLYKLPAIISDLLTSYLIYKIVKNIKNEKAALFGSAIYLFNPAIFANSTLWGQADSLVALFSILSIYLLTINLSFSAIALAVGTLIKPQAAFIAPFILVLMIKNKLSIPKIISFGLLALAVFVLAFIPFQNEPNLFNFIIHRLALSANQYPHTAVNSFNFWGLFGQWESDNLISQYGGYSVFLILFAVVTKKFWKRENFSYILASFIFSFTFVFFTRMHERHLLPVFAPLAIVVATEPVFAIAYIGLSLTYIANLYYAFVWLNEHQRAVFDPMMIKFLILLNIFLTFFIIYTANSKKRVEGFILRIKNYLNRGRRIVKTEAFTKSKLSPKVSKMFLVLILAFSLVTRVYRINVPEKDYFDEIYHAFTARIILHGDPKAWEWWNPHPEGFAYEWTHPPLSKLMMVTGMKVFGEDSFGWRIPQAIFGTLSILMVYLLSKKIFKDEVVALLSSFIFSLDGLFLVLTRMAMNDVYVLFFMLTSVYFFMSEKDKLSALSLGFAIASKWSAIWTIPILFVLWLRRKNKFSPSLFISFLILPIGIYLLTYLPMFLTGHDLGTWWGMQQQMWWYHTGLRATHPYTSPWWSWPLDLRPVYLYTSEEIGGMVSRIYAIGNPLIFWFGLVSIVMALTYAYFEKNKKLGFIVFSYLIFFVPWAASPRIMFLYHYLPSVPFMCMATAYVIRRFPKVGTYFLAFAVFSFIYFYPHWAGLPVPLWLDKSYYWVASWR